MWCVTFWNSTGWVPHQAQGWKCYSSLLDGFVQICTSQNLSEMKTSLFFLFSEQSCEAKNKIGPVSLFGCRCGELSSFRCLLEESQKLKKIAKKRSFFCGPKLFLPFLLICWTKTETQQNKKKLFGQPKKNKTKKGKRKNSSTKVSFCGGGQKPWPGYSWVVGVLQSFWQLFASSCCGEEGRVSAWVNMGGILRCIHAHLVSEKVIVTCISAFQVFCVTVDPFELWQVFVVFFFSLVRFFGLKFHSTMFVMFHVRIPWALQLLLMSSCCQVGAPCLLGSILCGLLSGVKFFCGFAGGDNNSNCPPSRIDWDTILLVIYMKSKYNKLQTHQILSPVHEKTVLELVILSSCFCFLSFVFVFVFFFWMSGGFDWGHPMLKFKPSLMCLFCEQQTIISKRKECHFLRNEKCQIRGSKSTTDISAQGSLKTLPIQNMIIPKPSPIKTAPNDILLEKTKMNLDLDFDGKRLQNVETVFLFRVRRTNLRNSPINPKVLALKNSFFPQLCE